MYIFFYLSLLLLFLYGILIKYYERCWKNIPDFDLSTEPIQAEIKLSVIIPARNESANIISCLQSISAQHYPVSLFEVIVINDHSTDDTSVLVETFPMNNLKLLQLSDYLQNTNIYAYKKKAIEVGIAAACGELIVTTDADCIVKPDWLGSLAAFYSRKNAAFIAAPVKINPGKSLLSIFQSIDFITLQGITAAAVHDRFHNMCNGANLVYPKEIFYQVSGFEGIDNIASGDDMLLMKKISSAFPERLFFIKSRAVIVTTEAAKSWLAFINQRVRWASKSGNYKDIKISSVLLLVYLVNLFLIVFIVAGFFNPVWFIFYVLLTVIKTIVEFSFVSKVAAFFDGKKLMIYFPFLQPLHMLYIVVAGWLGLFGSYKWKDRKVK